jgi:hypothetical protein
MDLSSCCCCTKISNTASSAVFVAVSYCWADRSRINPMHVPGEDVPWTYQAVAVAPKILTQQEAQFLFLFHIVGFGRIRINLMRVSGDDTPSIYPSPI